MKQLKNTDPAILKDLCLYYHIGECLGYCKKEVDPNIFNDMTNELRLFADFPTPKY